MRLVNTEGTLGFVRALLSVRAFECFDYFETVDHVFQAHDPEPSTRPTGR